LEVNSYYKEGFSGAASQTGAIMKILVVDDDRAVRDFLRNALETIGHHVIGEAEDGMEALSFYEKQRPDLVFMDIDMPIMDGFDIIDVVRRIDPNAKIVVITGTSRQLAEAHGAGALGLLRKPFKYEDLEKLLSQIQAAFRVNPKIRPQHLTQLLKRTLPLEAVVNGIEQKKA
jgi:two-component system chemotaxis response regulator CheY